MVSFTPQSIGDQSWSVKVSVQVIFPKDYSDVLHGKCQQHLSLNGNLHRRNPLKVMDTLKQETSRFAGPRILRRESTVCFQKAKSLMSYEPCPLQNLW